MGSIDGGVDPTPDGPPTTEIMCEQLAPLASGTCEVVDGDTTTLIKGIILTPTAVYRGGKVVVNPTGQITCVGCDCAAPGATVVSCPDGVVSPGLINTHDHITFTQNQPYNDTGVRYDDRQQWRKGLDGKPKISSSGGATADQIRWGELRFLMGGATSIVGSGGQAGLLRNLDSSTNQEGLNQKAVEFDTFPLDDSGGTRRTGDCNYGGTAFTAADLANEDAFEPHTSEGVNATARNEFLCQSNPDHDTAAPGVANNLVTAKTAMIHAIGLTASDYAAMAAGSTGLIWSPRSNITLYGDTARVSTAARLGVSISLGTDWMPTGSMNLLRELRCAADYNATYLDNFFSDQALWQMVTGNAAQATKTDDVVGLLAEGKIADISIFAAHGKTFRAIVDAEPQDVALVMRGGKILYGDSAAVGALAVGCDAVDVCGTAKQVCLMSEVGKSYTALKTAAGTSYDAFKCGPPPNEPSCTPKRPTAVAGSSVFTGVASADDSDGDGIPNATDNCPTMFNPVRPLDASVQGDADDDGLGDVCDVCPINANTNTCSVANPDDRDNDTIPNSTDNCPDAANTDQADTDMDGKGDVCDACPSIANPGVAGCPTTIYAIKTGAVPVGATVSVQNALVTGKGSNGFFVQTKTGDAGYLGADNSGIFVYTGTLAPNLAIAAVGLRVTVEGKVTNFGGQIELDGVTTVTATTTVAEAAPAPVPVTYPEIATGGTRAAALESVIVTLGPSTTTAVNTMFGEVTVLSGTTSLIVDDFLVVQPSPTVGKAYASLTGILALRQAASKLEPRSLADIVTGAPSIASFGPALSYAKVNQTSGAPTFPVPLTITLTGPAQGNTVIMVTSGNTNALTTANVTIPDGQTTAQVLVTAVAQNADVTIGAMLGLQVLDAHVRVVGAAELPSVVTLTPADTAVLANGTVQFTVTLDVPAAVGGTAVGISEAPVHGTFPATVTVLATQVSQTFTYTNSGPMGTSTLTATLGGSTSNAAITVSAAPEHLVINEVDYDQMLNPDSTEFIEIYNPGAAAVSLAGKQLLLVNGSGGAVYATIDLTGTLAAKGYLVIAGANVTVTAPATKFDPGWTTDEIQNGGPDGIALIDNVTHTLIDAVSYEGSMTMIDLPGFAAQVSLVEGVAATAKDDNQAGSMCRSPNGQDTDQANVDWKLCATLTPGTANP